LEATCALAGVQSLGPLRAGPLRGISRHARGGKREPEETAMRRRFTDPEDKKVFKRWTAINLAVYLTLMLALAVVAHFASPAGNDQVVQAPANAPAIERTVTR
jgi:hypothetical protein